MSFARPTYEEAIARLRRRGGELLRKKGMGRGRIRRRPMVTTKPKPGSRRALKEELKPLTAQVAKARGGHQCGQCAEDGVESNCVIDAGHLYPVSAFPAVEFDLDNIRPQCRRHNTIHIGNPTLYFDWYQRNVGAEKLEALHERAVGKSPTNDELVRMIAERKAEVARMRADLEMEAA